MGMMEICFAKHIRETIRGIALIVVLVLTFNCNKIYLEF